MTAHAQTLVDDPFTDGSRSNAAGGDTSGAVWFGAGPTLTVADDSAGIGSGNALSFQGGAFSKMLAFFQPTTLATAGQTLTLSFDYRYTSAPSSAPNGLRVGLGNSNDSRQTGDGGGTSRNDDWNYGFNTNPGLVGSNTRLCQEAAGDDVLGGGGTGARSQIGTAGASIASGTSKHTARLKITRLMDGDLSLEAQIDIETKARDTRDAASVLGYAFDEVLIGFGDTSGTILIDNVLVTLTTEDLASITASDATAAEIGLETGSFTVTRSNPIGTLRLPYNVSGTATAGEDYAPLAGFVDFANGQSTANVVVTPLEDWLVETNESITVTLLPPSGMTAAPASATATLSDNPAVTIPSDALFFSQLDLTRPGLAAVQSAVAANNFPAARSALAAYFRARTTPVFPTPNFTPNQTTVDDALQHKYTVGGISHDFEPEPVTTIDWSYNPNGALHIDWTHLLNRHDWWNDLARKYQISPSTSAAYLNEFLFELRDWITNSPVKDAVDNSPGSRWRTIDAGIRTWGSWPDSFYRLKSALTDDDLVLWLKSFYMHGRHLRKFTAGENNWVASEQRGLYTIGTIFPEFKEAESWRSLAVSRLEALLASDFYPDGSSAELSPAYHDRVLENIESVKSLAALNSLPVPTAFDSTLEMMYAYEMWACEPIGNIPDINDSWRVNVRARLADGFALFPHRTDFQWVSTTGTAGTLPDQTSHLFPDAGQVVMRSGWGTSDSYLLMEAGPYGDAHQHEDKLSISVDGYGTRHVIDCGTYDYGQSLYRTHSVSSHANSQPVIDGLDQNRKADPTLQRHPTPITWRTTPQYDYTAASYGEDSREGWGPTRARPASTRRHIFFMKPDVWVVIDAFKALDTASHTYTGIFHCSDDTVATDAATQRITVQLLPGEFDPYTRTTVSSAKPSLTITPLLANAQTVQVIKGQDSPTIFGYQYEKDTTYKKQPIPSVRYDRTVTGDTQMAYVLAAAPTAAAAPRTPTITPAVTASDTYGVTVSFGVAGDATTFLIGLDGQHTTWKGITHDEPSLVIKSSGVYDWDGNAYAQNWDGNGNASAGGNWSSAPNWDSDAAAAPTTGNIARLGNTGADRTVIYDAAASGTLGSLEVFQSSAFSNLLEVRKNLSVTNGVTLGATAGTAHLHVLPASAADITLTADVTVNAGGQLSLGAFNPPGVATVNVGRVTGNVTIAGGRLALSDVVAQGSMTAATVTFNTVIGDLGMSDGVISFANTGYSNRRLQVTGNLNITGGTLSADNPALAASLVLSGASNVMNATSFEAPKISMVLNASVDQTLTTSNSLGVIAARGSGIKTFATSSGNITQLQIIDGSSSPGVGITFRLGSHVTAGISPTAPSFGNIAEAGRIDLGIDTSGYTLSLSAADGWTPNASSQSGVTNTVWNLTGSGAIQAASFNLATAGVTTTVAANTALIATGGNSTANDLGGTGTINGNSIFRYSGTAVAGTPATLTSDRNLGDLEVTSGALRVLTTSTGTMQDLRVSGGSLDLDGHSSRSFSTITLTGGTLANGTYATAEANYTGLQTGTISGRLTGAKQLIKSSGDTLILSGANDHSGNTIVNAGTLHLAQSGQLRFILGATSGSSNVLSGTGSATLDGAFVIDTTAAAALSSGTWLIENVTTLTGPYGSTFRVVDPGGSTWTDAGNHRWTKDAGSGRIWTFTETTGLLTLGALPSAYEAWGSGFVGFTQTDLALDPDNDGMANLLEFVLGGNPTTSDMSNAPALHGSETHVTFTFKRSDQSEQQAITVKVQVSDTLSAWNAANDITIGPGPNGTGPGGATYTVDETGSHDTIVVTIPKAAAARKFVRLRASAAGN